MAETPSQTALAGEPQFAAGAGAEPRIETFGLILGGMKCGSTSLYDYLVTHPQVAQCRVKEPNFFSVPKGRGSEHYAALWRGFDPARHRVALHHHVVPLGGVAEVVEALAEVVGPEEGHASVALVPAQHVSGRDPRVLLGHPPMFYAHRLRPAGEREQRDVAGRAAGSSGVGGGACDSVALTAVRIRAIRSSCFAYSAS